MPLIRKGSALKELSATVQQAIASHRARGSRPGDAAMDEIPVARPGKHSMMRPKSQACAAIRTRRDRSAGAGVGAHAHHCRTGASVLYYDPYSLVNVNV